MPYGRKRPRPSYARSNPRRKRRRIIRSYHRSMLRRRCRPELKFKNIAYTTAIATTGTVHHISNIDQGNSPEQRVGWKITSRSLLLRVKLTVYPSATDTSVRMMIVRYTDTSFPTVTGVLQTAHVQAPLNLLDNNKVRVLWDRMITVYQDKPEVTFKIYKKFYFPTEFNADESTDVKLNNLYVIMVSDEGTQTPTIVYRGRYRYTDA